MVFLILAAQYERWSLPLSVLLALPFGTFGALAALEHGDDAVRRPEVDADRSCHVCSSVVARQLNLESLSLMLNPTGPAVNSH
jgi:hypothetical protein